MSPGRVRVDPALIEAEPRPRGGCRAGEPAGGETMTTRLTLLAAIAAALAAPATATAGGWATVGLDLPPENLARGEPWQAELTILQHGVTPLDGVRPRVIVRREDGIAEKAFAARATGEPGVYHATVVFGSAGTWNYWVDDDFAAKHSYPPVRIGKGGQRDACADTETAEQAGGGGAGGSPSGGAPAGEGGSAGGGEAAVGGEFAAAASTDNGRGEATGSGGDGPDYLPALAAAAVAALAAGLGAAAFQRR